MFFPFHPTTRLWTPPNKTLPYFQSKQRVGQRVGWIAVYIHPMTHFSNLPLMPSETLILHFPSTPDINRVRIETSSLEIKRKKISEKSHKPAFTPLYKLDNHWLIVERFLGSKNHLQALSFIMFALLAVKAYFQNMSLHNSPVRALVCSNWRTK